ncbi:GAF domain-containing protein [Mesorhizobium sp. CAU 1741]|uniref:GAF domain-containing protein n=1 Tax=Mesorhizobium sp. CAU 1741 TaxID=3140366 RepID=UPI00325A5697
MTSRPLGRFDAAAALAAIGGAQAGSGQPATTFAAFDHYCQEAVGHRLFTMLEWAPATNDVERLYSSRPVEYLLLGRKAMGPTEWGAKVLKGGENWIGRNADDIRWAFPDHELIASLGCAACINAPILWDGAVLGVVSVLGPENAYDDNDLAGLVAIAPLLAPAFLARRA